MMIEGYVKEEHHFCDVSNKDNIFIINAEGQQKHFVLLAKSIAFTFSLAQEDRGWVLRQRANQQN